MSICSKHQSHQWFFKDFVQKCHRRLGVRALCENDIGTWKSISMLVVLRVCVRLCVRAHACFRARTLPLPLDVHVRLDPTNKNIVKPKNNSRKTYKNLVEPKKQTRKANNILVKPKKNQEKPSKI